jgi:signal recognition particle subunit SRP54
MAKIPKEEFDTDSMKYIEAIIRSMTIEERNNPQIINGSRRKRIANGSGTSVQEVNRLLKDFEKMQKMLKMMKKRGGFAMPGMM